MLAYRCASAHHNGVLLGQPPLVFSWRALKYDAQICTVAASVECLVYEDGGELFWIGLESVQIPLQLAYGLLAPLLRRKQSSPSLKKLRSREWDVQICY